MKSVIILTCLFCISAEASYLPESLIGKDTTGKTIFSFKKDCEVAYSEPCVKITENLEYNELAANKKIVINPAKKAAFDLKKANELKIKQDCETLRKTLQSRNLNIVEINNLLKCRF